MTLDKTKNRVAVEYIDYSEAELDWITVKALSLRESAQSYNARLSLSMQDRQPCYMPYPKLYL